MFFCELVHSIFASQTIYSSQAQAIVTIHAVSSPTLLMYIENTNNALDQNGLWKLKTVGSGLTRLTTVPGQKYGDLELPAQWPQIVSNSQSYALRISQDQNQVPATALMVGTLNGGTPTTFASVKLEDGIMFLVGWAML